MTFLRWTSAIALTVRAANQDDIVKRVSEEARDNQEDVVDV
jgi:hypothetical protein